MSIKVTFTIPGNHEEKTGNPIPFQRMIASQMRYAAGRYMAYQGYVRQQFERTATIELPDHTAPYPVKNFSVISDVTIPVFNFMNTETLRKERARLAIKPHPIKIKEYRAEMHLKIYWADETHGDADNVFKGVADSLFENDKELDGSFESFHSKDGAGIGRIEGIIIFDAGMKYA